MKVYNDIEATGFVKINGTSEEVLCADGSTTTIPQVPTKVSELENDSEFVTKSMIPVCLDKVLPPMLYEGNPSNYSWNTRLASIFYVDFYFILDGGAQIRKAFLPYSLYKDGSYESIIIVNTTRQIKANEIMCRVVGLPR